MTTYYKAARPDGTSFHDPTFRWLPVDGTIPGGGWLVEHPDATSPMDHADSHLSVATAPTDCTGFEWPCRLLEVEPAWEVVTPEPHLLPHKRASKAWRVVRELDPRLALGPNADRVLAVIERAGRLTGAEEDRMAAVRTTAWYSAVNAAEAAARVAAWVAAENATRVAVTARAAMGVAVRDAAGDAAQAELMRDLITQDQYNILTESWRAGVGDDWTR